METNSIHQNETQLPGIDSMGLQHHNGHLNLLSHEGIIGDTDASYLDLATGGLQQVSNQPPCNGAVNVSPSQSELVSNPINGKRGHNDSDSDSSSQPNKKSTSSEQDPYSVPVSNRFAPLEKLTENEKRFSYVNESAPQNNENIRIPPIYVNNVSNITEFNREIKMQITNQFTTDYNNSRAKLMFKTIADFRNAIKHLINTKRQFHTYKDPANKKFSVIFKNLHPSITLQEIYEDLKTKCTSLISVTRLHKNNIPIPVVAAEFDGHENIDLILQIKQICNLSVKPEKRRRPKGPIQCLRCLDFGHTKNNCNHAIACIYCSGDHYSAKCPQKNLPPICKLCTGTHRADLRTEECAYYQKIVEPISKRGEINNSKTSSRNNPPPRLSSQNFPNLPTTNNIPHFTFTPISPPRHTVRNQPYQNTSQHNMQANNNTNTFIHTLINSISSYIINLINTIIPTIINNVQNSLSSFFTNNNGRTTP